MQAALRRHDALVRGAVESNRGYVFKAMGDAFDAAFADASDALAAAVAAQRMLLAVGAIWGQVFTFYFSIGRP